MDDEEEIKKKREKFKNMTREELTGVIHDIENLVLLEEAICKRFNSGGYGISLSTVKEAIIVELGKRVLEDSIIATTE